MLILVNFGHPAHVHLFKNFVWQMEKGGHRFIFTHTKKDINEQLINKYNFNSTRIADSTKGIIQKIRKLIKSQKEIYKIVVKEKPDLLMGVASGSVTHVGKLRDIPTMIMDDTEISKYEIFLYKYFATKVLTPSCFLKDIGTSQVRYNGYHELSYLHPNYFKPDSSVLELMKLKKGEKFIIVRFVSWSASHDIGKSGIPLSIKKGIVNKISKNAKVFITSEGNLPVGLDEYRIKIPTEKMHDALYFASLYLGESATMTTESAMLGTPSIFVSNVNSAENTGNLKELSEKYNMVECYSPSEISLGSLTERCLNLISDDIKEEYRAKRERMLLDKIDVTSFMTEFVSNGRIG